MAAIINATIGEDSLYRSLAHQLFDDERQTEIIKTSIQTEVNDNLSYYSK